MDDMIQRSKQVLQVRKNSSSSGTYLCSMQGDACRRWKLREMFPPRYRVFVGPWIWIKEESEGKGREKMKCELRRRRMD
jgi:hypothetical protein